MNELFLVFYGQQRGGKSFATWEPAANMAEAVELAKAVDNTEESGVVVRVWVDENGLPRMDFTRSLGGADDR